MQRVYPIPVTLYDAGCSVMDAPLLFIECITYKLMMFFSFIFNSLKTEGVELTFTAPGFDGGACSSNLVKYQRLQNS